MNDIEKSETSNPKEKSKQSGIVKLENRKIMGRPPIVTTPEEFEERAEAYFRSLSCPAVDEETGRDYVRWLEVPSMSGLALALGYSSRDSLHDLSVSRSGFESCYAKAKSIMETVKVGKLYTLKNPNGCIFDLRANHGMRDTQQIDINVSVGVSQTIEAARMRAMKVQQMQDEQEEQDEHDE